MIKISSSTPHSSGDAGWAIAVGYATADRQAGLAALLALDRTLGAVLRTTTAPVVGQMRLAWWREALSALETAPPPAQPVLAALAAEVLPHGVEGTMLARSVDGWERLLLAERLDAAVLEQVAAERGATLFALASVALGGEATATVASAGEAWALADMAMRLSDSAAAAIARDLAARRWPAAFATRWPPRLRALGALTLLTRFEAEPGAGGWWWAARLLWHRVTGG